MFKVVKVNIFSSHVQISSEGKHLEHRNVNYRRVLLFASKRLKGLIDKVRFLTMGLHLYRSKPHCIL